MSSALAKQLAEKHFPLAEHWAEKILDEMARIVFERTRQKAASLSSNYASEVEIEALTLDSVTGPE